MSGSTILTPPAFQAPVRKARLLLASLPLFAGLLDPDGTVLECNFGPLSGELETHDGGWIGKPFETGGWWNYSEASRAEILIALGQAQRGQQVETEKLYRKPTGEMGVMQLTLKPLFAPYDQPDAILVMAVDVTEKRQASDTADRIAHDMAHRLRNSFTIMRALATQNTDEDAALSTKALSRRLSCIQNSHALTYRYLFFDVPIQDVIHTAIPDPSNITRSGYDPVSIPSDHVEALLMALGELASPGHAATLSAQKRGTDHVRIRWTETKKRPETDMPTGLSRVLIQQNLESRTDGTVIIRNGKSGFLWQFEAPIPSRPIPQADAPPPN